MRFRRRAAWFFRAGLILLISVCGANAQSVVHSYRYQLSTRSQESAFAGEISPGARVGGQIYEVETDAQGRRIRVSVLRNGQKLSETIYRFAGNAKLPSEYDDIEAGEKTGLGRIQRNEAGQRNREDFFTAGGTLTGYDVYFYGHPPLVEITGFTADGKKKNSFVFDPTSRDTLKTIVRYSNPTDATYHTDSVIDENTGLVQTRSQSHQTIVNTQALTYDSDGDLTRTDFYDANHIWYVGDEFNNGLRIKRIYKMEAARGRCDNAWRRKRWLKRSAVVYIKDVLVCRLVVDRLPDGTAKRTLALGPDGVLWAEYPNLGIADINQNGQPANGQTSIIHKTGNWW